ncbi:MAG: cysteine-rich CWC family protein [Propionivibrio sp.]|uniref:cysteine-rich CWC family protein n=1 Tax=Propionivibrio sp. TaxID=2212460 RepID=UPI0025FB24E8|nr:cysteine-rich CWC family protein [Propionivibrio sp.]MBL0208982.1 cysteine-rich CWC family protein [Propionivibrio sp.]
MTVDQDAKPTLCASCGTSLVCGAVAGLPSCWCMERPSGLFEAVAGGSCFCPACLDRRISQQSSRPT